MQTVERHRQYPSEVEGRAVHQARDKYERPLVGLCGFVSEDSTYAGLPKGTQVTCVVCADLMRSR